MGAFHAYDVRGVYGTDFTLEDVYRIGFHLVGYLGAREVAVGRDARISSPAMFEALSRGITDAGADVLDLGLATTPMVYYATCQLGLRASVQITASHNPKQYNGLKISREGAQPVGYQTGLAEIERRVRDESLRPVASPGRIRPVQIREEYIGFLRQFGTGFSNLRVVVDCSNGMAGLLAREVLGDAPTFLFETPDGTFPNHEANPLLPENTVALRRAVRELGCDVGMIFDGDADRVLFVDERGRAVPPDLMIAVLGLHFHHQGKLDGARVLVDVRTSRDVASFLEPLGATVQSWRVGRAFMAARLQEIDGIFGGELAGHYYFRDFSYSDSGLLAGVLLLSVLSRLKSEGITLGQLIDQIQRHANTGELNFHIEDKPAAMEAVRAYFTQERAPSALYDYDGYRIEWPDWWLSIRPSNTEPLLRFLAEAESEELLARKVEQARALLAPFVRED